MTSYGVEVYCPRWILIAVKLLRQNCLLNRALSVAGDTGAGRTALVGEYAFTVLPGKDLHPVFLGCHRGEKYL